MSAPLAQPTAPELWTAFRRGDEQAYAALYEQHAPALYEYGVRLVQEEYLVRDALHDLFVRLWTQRTTLGAVDNVRYYLLASLRNALRTSSRRDQRYQHVSLDDDDDGEAPFTLSFSPEAEAMQHEQQQAQAAQLAQALEQLSSRQKQVIYLRYYEGLEYLQIADLLAINVKGVYKLTARALAALKDILDVPLPLLLVLLAAGNLASLRV